MTTPPDRSGDEFEQPTGESARRPAGCALFDSMAAELALGSLAGADRSRALAHLEGCDECRQLLDELSVAADALLLAAPEADPPAGFEVRWLGRIRDDSPVVAPELRPAARRRAARRWSRATTLVAAAASALVLAGAGVGVGVAVASHPAPAVATGPIRMATLHLVGYDSDGAAVGEVAVSTGDPSFVVMTMRQTGWSGRVECVVTAKGRSEVVGSFWLRDGAGSWALRLPESGGSVTAASVRAVGGAVIATATFSG